MKRSLFLLIVFCLLAGRPASLDAGQVRAGAQAAVRPYLVKDINPSTDWKSSVSNLVQFNNRLVFTANDGLHGTSLWQSDGTAAGTVIFKDFDENASHAPGGLTVVNNVLFFSAASKIGGKPVWNELWMSDGTAGGTVRVKQFYPSQDAVVTGLTAAGNLVFFYVILPPLPGEKGSIYELWRSDGTAAGTIWLNEFSALSDLTNANGLLYFVATSRVVGGDRGLWTSNGTPSGTLVLKSSTGEYISSPERLAYSIDTVFFIASKDSEKQVWKTHGTAASTVPLTAVHPGIGYGATGSLLTPCNGLIFFTADDGVSGYELWATGSTSVSVKRVKDIYPGKTSSFPYSPFCLDGKLIFEATGADGKDALWRSDGTEAGTVKIKDIVPDGYLRVFIASHGLYFFSAMNAASTERDLWKSDGTSAGTVNVSNGVPYAVNSYLSTSPRFTVANGVLFFAGDDQTHGVELWGLSLQDLALTQSVAPQTPAAPGQQVTYTISFQNNGHIAAGGVAIGDSLPTQLENITWQSSGVNVTLAATSPHTWQVAEMQPGQGGTITIKAGIRQGYAAGHTFSNTATIANSMNEADRANNSSPATVTVANAAPVANDDTLSAFAGRANTLNVLANDRDPNADRLTVASVTEPLNGSAVANGSSVVYTPTKGYLGKDTFDYTVSDGHGGTHIASVLVVVSPATYHAFLPVGIRNWPPRVHIDDAPDLCKDAYPITDFTKIYQDDFDKETDPDWYRFAATTGTHYTVDVTAASGTRPVLRLYDSDCRYLELQGVPSGGGTRLQWTHGWPSGTYYWMIYEAYGRYGSQTIYQLKVQATAP